MKKLLIFVSVITILTLGLTKNKIQAAEHPKGDDTKVEHPKGEDTKTEHPKAEHPKAKHPEGEHEHPTGDDAEAERVLDRSVR